MKTYSLDEQDDQPPAQPDRLDAFDGHQRPKVHKSAVRFFAHLARSHNVRLSALVLYVVACTRQRFNAGLRDRRAAWHMSEADFGAQIDAGEKQVSRLLRKAKAAGLLNFTRTCRGVLVWVPDSPDNRALYTLDWSDEGDARIGRFHPRLARLLGLNASILYLFNRYHSRTGDGCRRGPRGYATVLPWMRPAVVAKELAMLLEMGLLHRDREDCGHFMAWRYFCPATRTGEDRAKFAKYVDKKQRRKKCPLDGKSVRSFGKNVRSHGKNVRSFGKIVRTKEPYTVAIYSSQTQQPKAVVPSPRPAEAKPPAVVSPAAEDEGQVRFASFFEEDNHYCKRVDREEAGIQAREGGKQEITPVVRKQAVISPAGKEITPKQTGGVLKDMITPDNRKPKAESRQKDVSGVKAEDTQAHKPVSSVKAKAPTPEAEGKQAKDNSKGLSGSPPQAARPAGTNGKMESNQGGEQKPERELSVLEISQMIEKARSGSKKQTAISPDVLETMEAGNREEDEELADNMED